MLDSETWVFISACHWQGKLFVISCFVTMTMPQPGDIGDTCGPEKYIPNLD
jgi:hypothetical protein